MLYEIVLKGKKVSYELTRKQVKNINARIQPNGLVKVSAPPRIRLSSVESFFRANQDRILDAIAMQTQRTHLKEKSELFEDGGKVYYLGEPYCLRVKQGGTNGVVLQGGELVLTVKDLTDPSLRKKTVQKWMTERCKERVIELSQRIYPYFAPHGFPFPTFRFRFMKSRWGSCQINHNILTFNTHLIEKPIECISFVVAHEFTHFIHADHSPKFYAELERIMPAWKSRKKLLDE